MALVAGRRAESVATRRGVETRIFATGCFDLRLCVCCRAQGGRREGLEVAICTNREVDGQYTTTKPFRTRRLLQIWISSLAKSEYRPGI